MSDKTYFENAYFIIGTAYAGKSTMVKELAKRHGGIACEENYHDNYPEICNQGKPVFVDTNISIATLKKIAPVEHTLVMLADPMISVRRFFERPDPEKQFLYKLIMDEPDPE